jgi:hypothetical protein
VQQSSNIITLLYNGVRFKTKYRRKHYALTNENYQCNFWKFKAHKLSQNLACDRQTDMKKNLNNYV